MSTRAVRRVMPCFEDAFSDALHIPRFDGRAPTLSRPIVRPQLEGCCWPRCEDCTTRLCGCTVSPRVRRAPIRSVVGVYERVVHWCVLSFLSSSKGSSTMQHMDPHVQDVRGEATLPECPFACSHCARRHGGYRRPRLLQQTNTPRNSAEECRVG